MKIMKKNNFTFLCNAQNSIFDEECLYSTDSLETVFNNNLVYEESLSVLIDFNQMKYDYQEFLYLFNTIRGRQDYFIIIKILNRTLSRDLLLINWDLTFSSSDNNTLLSFKEY